MLLLWRVQEIRTSQNARLPCNRSRRSLISVHGYILHMASGWGEWREKLDQAHWGRITMRSVLAELFYLLYKLRLSGYRVTWYLIETWGVSRDQKGVRSIERWRCNIGKGRSPVVHQSWCWCVITTRGARGGYPVLVGVLSDATESRRTTITWS